jgi:hypothetical protein
MSFKKGEPRPSNAGRKVGASNKITRDIREMILAALDKVGGITYLTQQAKDNPTAFLSLLGKVMPTQINATVDKRDVTELSRDELLALIASCRQDRREDEPPQISLSW